jgi:hypothetical protein
LVYPNTDGADGDEDGPPHAKEVLVATMAAISHRQQQQDGKIRPLPRWKKGSTSAAAPENSRKNME